MGKKQPLYPHVPNSKKYGSPPHSSIEDLQVKLVDQMIDERGAENTYYEMAKTFELAGQPYIARELRSIGNMEKGHFSKLEELERRLRSGG